MKSIYMMRRKTATTLEIKGVVAVFFKIRRGGATVMGTVTVAVMVISMMRKVPA